MLMMVDAATAMSFVTAPVLAYINYRVITGSGMPEEAKPGKALRVLSWVGIIFFTVFTIVYLYWRIFV
jgi:Mn2+/Fe2+ NRAMP family transporter